MLCVPCSVDSVAELVRVACPRGEQPIQDSSFLAARACGSRDECHALAGSAQAFVIQTVCRGIAVHGHGGRTHTFPASSQKIGYGL